MSEIGYESMEQRRKLGRGLAFSIAGLLLAIVPGLGALLSLIGLFITISTYAPDCTGRYAAFVVISLICAIISVGALCAMLYVYYGNPELLRQITDKLVEFVGQRSPSATTAPLSATNAPGVLG